MSAATATRSKRPTTSPSIPEGLLYVTEFLNARVSTITPEGKAEVLIADVPGANGITIFRDRIFMDECRPEARVVELFRDGRAPKVLAQGLDLANALSVGPDEMLYFPQLAKGEVCRVSPDGGPLERVVDGLAVPTAVKFDNHGFLLVIQALYRRSFASRYPDAPDQPRRDAAAGPRQSGRHA